MEFRCPGHDENVVCKTLMIQGIERNNLYASNGLIVFY